MNPTIQRKVGIAALIVMISILLSRVIGLFREMAIAYVGGASGLVDAYQVAFILPEILNHIVASGFLSVTFIPIFSDYLARDNETEGWHVFSAIHCVFGSFLILLIIAAIIGAPHLVQWLAPGFKDPEKIALAVRMTRIIIPAQFFFFNGGLFMAVQFAREKFAMPALAPVFYNIGIITGGLLLGPWIGIEGFAWGVLGGAFVGNFAIQYIGARKVGMRFRFNFDFRHPGLTRFIRLTLPLIVGLTMMFSTELFFKFFGSFLAPGNISGLNYSLRVMLILVGLFGQAAGVAATPYLSRLAVEKQFGEMNKLLNTTLRYLGLVIPFSALFMVLRAEIITLLFQRGNFDAADTALTANILLFLMLGAFAFAAQTVVVRCYYAMQNTLLPALLGTIAVILSIPLYWGGMILMDAAGVALAISLSAILQVSVLYLIWNKKSHNTESGRVFRFYSIMAGLAILTGGVLEPLRQLIRSHLHGSAVADSLACAIIIGALFTGLILTAGKGLGITEIAEMRKRLFARFFKHL